MSTKEVRLYRDCGLLQEPRRHQRRPDKLSFHAEHLKRLLFIKHALACGFTHEDVVKLVNPVALVTCGDVYAVANRRLAAMQATGRAGSPEATCLAQLRQSCQRVGPRADCKVIEVRSSPGG
ncbi:MAG: hypothetical protein JOY81_09205 [Alphaproteobacteria bacterium]|nr:hypothetical protein [Alphaproteobacteria bacterium]